MCDFCVNAMTDTAGDIMYDKCAKCKDGFHMDDNHNCADSSS